MNETLPDVLALPKTKIDSSSPSFPFVLDNYFELIRKDRDCYGGGIMLCIRKGLIFKLASDFEPSQFSEGLGIEVTVQKKKWIILSICRPPNQYPIHSFIEELTHLLSKASSHFDSIIVMGDLNMDTGSNKDNCTLKLQNFCGVFSLSNLI